MLLVRVADGVSTSFARASKPRVHVGPLRRDLHCLLVGLQVDAASPDCFLDAEVDDAVKAGAEIGGADLMSVTGSNAIPTAV